MSETRAYRFRPAASNEREGGPRRIPLSAPTEKDEKKMARVSSGKKTKRLVYSFRLLLLNRTGVQSYPFTRPTSAVFLYIVLLSYN